MATETAGLLLFRNAPDLQVLLVHMGGPYWQRKDAGAWTIPKGGIEEGESALDAAVREFQEETGHTPVEPFYPLGRHRQNSAKYLSCWAAAGYFDPTRIKSVEFEMEWPKGSGRYQSFPEADKAAWLSRDEAFRLIVKGQTAVLLAFFDSFAPRSATAVQLRE
jgi:predicted NUDIX family NTP pyrophosphohydrolase